MFITNYICISCLLYIYFMCIPYVYYVLYIMNIYIYAYVTCIYIYNIPNVLYIYIYTYGSYLEVPQGDHQTLDAKSLTHDMGKYDGQACPAIVFSHIVF